MAAPARPIVVPHFIFVQQDIPGAYRMTPTRHPVAPTTFPSGQRSVLVERVDAFVVIRYRAASRSVMVSSIVVREVGRRISRCPEYKRGASFFKMQVAR